MAGAGAKDGFVALEGVGGTTPDASLGLPCLLLFDGGLSVDALDESNTTNGLFTGVAGGTTARWGGRGWESVEMASSFQFPRLIPGNVLPS